MKPLFKTVCALVLSANIHAAAQSSLSLDNSFGSSGKIIVDVDGSYDFCTATLIQPDGKILAGGITSIGGVNQWIVMRMNADGTQDNSFNGNGKLGTGISCGAYSTMNMILQADGKLIVSSDENNGTLFRYNSDGSIDNAFGISGQVAIPTISYYGYSIQLQPDGKILTVAATNNYTLFRYNSDGSLDNTFGTNGAVIATIPSGGFHAACKTILTGGGKIILAGEHGGGPYELAILQFNADGSVDNSFGTNGQVVGANTSANSWLGDVILQSDAKLIIVSTRDYNNIYMLRYNADGSLDNSFGNGGKVISNFGSVYPAHDSASAAILLPNGQILLGGTSESKFALFRYNTDGSLDNTFGTNGRILKDLGTSNAAIKSMQIQADGKLIAAGVSSNSSNYDFAVVRYDAPLVGITEHVAKHDNLHAYPNPSNDLIHLSLKNGLIDGELLVNDLVGNLLIKTAIIGPSSEVNTSKLPNGLYIVSVKNGAEHYKTKISVAH